MTGVGNISNFLIDGQSAFIAQPGNITSISDKMMEVSENPDRADAIAAVGREVALREFNSLTETAKLLSIMFTK